MVRLPFSSYVILIWQQKAFFLPHSQRLYTHNKYAIENYIFHTLFNMLLTTINHALSLNTVSIGYLDTFSLSCFDLLNKKNIQIKSLEKRSVRYYCWLLQLQFDLWIGKLFHRFLNTKNTFENYYWIWWQEVSEKSPF